MALANIVPSMLVFGAVGFVLPGALQLIPEQRVKYNSYVLAAILLAIAILLLHVAPEEETIQGIGGLAQKGVNLVDSWLPTIANSAGAIAGLVLAEKKYDQWRR